MTSTRSEEVKRTSEVLPVLMLRRVIWTKARRLPGVRCWVSSTTATSPLWSMAIPLRISLAVGIGSFQSPYQTEKRESRSYTEFGSMQAAEWGHWRTAERSRSGYWRAKSLAIAAPRESPTRPGFCDIQFAKHHLHSAEFLKRLSPPGRRFGHDKKARRRQK